MVYTVEVPYTYMSSLGRRESKEIVEVPVSDPQRARNIAEFHVNNMPNVIEVHGTFLNEVWEE